MLKGLLVVHERLERQNEYDAEVLAAEHHQRRGALFGYWVRAPGREEKYTETSKLDRKNEQNAIRVNHYNMN